MESIKKNRDIKTSFLFAIMGAIASAFVALYQIDMLGDEARNQIVLQLGSIEKMLIIASIQGGLITLLSTLAGLKLARKVNLKLNFRFDKKSLEMAIEFGFVTALIIVLSDRFIFARYLPSKITDYKFSVIYLVSGVLYGGIVEEILLRLFVMSLFVFILWKLFAKHEDNKNIPRWIYISSIIMSSVLFAAGHIPVTAQLIGISLPILIRTFVLNGIGGIGFGYLYWRKGLSYSMCAHAFTHIFMNLVLLLLVFMK